MSDGVFAVAITLLILDVRPPAVSAIRTEQDLWRALVSLAPRLVVFLMSFVTLDIFWVGQQTQLNHVAESNRHLTWIHLAFLFAVSLMPFSTSFLAEFIGYRIAVVEYWANILLLGVVLYGSWGYAVRARLVEEAVPPEVPAAICRRIVIAQSLYAVGVLLCLVSTYWSIGFIVLLQLYYAVAPRFRHRA